MYYFAFVLLALSMLCALAGAPPIKEHSGKDEGNIIIWEAEEAE